MNLRLKAKRVYIDYNNFVTALGQEWEWDQRSLYSLEASAWKVLGSNPGKGKRFSLLQKAQTGSEAHLVS